MSPNFNDVFSRTTDNTLRSVFPNMTRVIVNDHYDIWKSVPNGIVNTLYLYSNNAKVEDPTQIYSDNKNRVFYDKPRDYESLDADGE